MTALLKLENIVVRYAKSGHNASPVLNRLSLELRQGEILGLVGASGSGKTTLARVITGLLNPEEGQIYFKEQSLTHHRLKTRLALTQGEVQMVFQNPYSAFDPLRRIGWQMEETLFLRQWPKGEKRYRRVIEALERVGLDERYYDRYPHELSGGQLQRVALGCALMIRPSLLIADEPVSALDVSVQAQILNLIQVIQKTVGFSCLFISHDLQVVHYLCDRVAFLKDGEIVDLVSAKNLMTEAKHPYAKALLSTLK